jgi:hypothetical protein
LALKAINSECVVLLIIDGGIITERARVTKGEIFEQDKRFLSVYLEARNSCLVLLSEREDKLGTLAISVPRPKGMLGPPSSSILVGDRNTTSAKMFAEYLATAKGKIAHVSIYLESVDELQAQSAFRKLMEMAVGNEEQKGALTA